MIKHLLLAAGIAALPLACSDDDEQPEEAVQMPGDEGSASTGMPPTEESNLGGIDAPSVGDLQGSDAQSAAAKAAAIGAKATGLGNSGVGTNNSQLSGSGMYVRCAVLRVRSGPGLGHKTVGFVTFNQEVQAQSDLGSKWIKIGENQFVSRKYLSDQKNSKQWAPAH